jgi:predicted glycoside hydrolase/deacetylase ChbG (UPF0249 family)
MTTPQTPLALVVTADDFGIGRLTSEGIIQAHLRGPVTATSLMVITGEHVQSSLPLLENAPNLDVGLHVVLTRCGHKPLIATASSGLVGKDGQFLTNAKLWLKSFAGKINQSAVAEEIVAQAELFRKLLGRSPTHVDSHHHAHQLPTIRDALAEVIGRGILPPITRTTIEPPGNLRKVPGVRAKRFAAGYVGQRAAGLFAAHQIRANDFFIGMLAGRDLEQDFPWKRFLEHLPQSGIVEWIVHPGLPDETLIGRDDYETERATELKALIEPPGIAEWQHLRKNLSRKSILFQS